MQLNSREKFQLIRPLKYTIPGTKKIEIYDSRKKKKTFCCLNQHCFHFFGRIPSLVFYWPRLAQIRFLLTLFLCNITTVSRSNDGHINNTFFFQKYVDQKWKFVMSLSNLSCKMMMLSICTSLFRQDFLTHMPRKYLFLIFQSFK